MRVQQHGVPGARCLWCVRHGPFSSCCRKAAAKHGKLCNSAQCHACQQTQQHTSMSMKDAALCAAGVKYGSRNVLADPDIREGIKAFTKWPTVPQVGLTPSHDVAALTSECSTKRLLPGSWRMFNICHSRSSSASSCMQVFIKGEFVGGSDILMGMHQSGELTEALQGTEKA